MDFLKFESLSDLLDPNFYHGKVALAHRNPNHDRDYDYMPEMSLKRIKYSSKSGKITKYFNDDGLCFEIKYDDGNCATWEPDEIKELYE